MNANNVNTQENVQNIVEKDILTTKQMRQILNAYSEYKPIENKFCLNIPISPRESDNKMTIAQFDELCRFYAYYHIFSVQEAKLKKSIADKESQKEVDKTIHELRIQCFKEFAKKDNTYQLYPLYKKVNAFKGHEEIIKNIFNSHFKNYKSSIDVENLISVADCKVKFDYPSDKCVKPIAEIVINTDSTNSKELEMFYARKFSKVLYLYRHIMKLQKEVFFQTEIENLKPNDAKTKKDLLKKIMKQFQNIIGGYVDGVVVQPKMKIEKSEPNANKFLALTWHAFSSLQDMKFEQDLNSNMVIAIKDSMFKNFAKKLNKLQKIYYANEIFSKAFTKTCKMCNVIIAYLSAKRINPTTKKVEYVNTYDNIKDTLSCELKLSYKEFEPKMKGTPKPKKEKPAQTKRHSKQKAPKE